MEKMEKNRIMLREAVELLRNRIEFELPAPDGSRRKFSDEALKKYNEHPATSRVDQERLNKIWEYFRPFERHENQRVVRNQDLEELREIIEGRSPNKSLADVDLKFVLDEDKDKTGRSILAKKLLQMTDTERKEFLTAVHEKREAEKRRLEERLKDIKMLESKLDEKEEEVEKTHKKDDKTS